MATDAVIILIIWEWFALLKNHTFWAETYDGLLVTCMYVADKTMLIYQIIHI